MKKQFYWCIYGEFNFTHRSRHIYMISKEEYSLGWRCEYMDGVGEINLDSIGNKEINLEKSI